MKRRSRGGSQSECTWLSNTRQARKISVESLFNGESNTKARTHSARTMWQWKIDEDCELDQCKAKIAASHGG